MSKYDLNTQKMRENSELLNKEITNFNEIVNKMFNRIYRMPNGTKEWEGISASNLASIAKKEKRDDFDAIISVMRKYAQEMNTSGNGFEKVERETKANDKNIVDDGELQ